MKSIADHILKTLAYADVFDFALTEAQLWKWYIAPKAVSFSQFRAILTDLLATKKITQRSQYWALMGRRAIIAETEKRALISKSKKKRALRAAYFLRFIPTIYFIGISGSLAVNNADTRDDIDLFVITAPHTVWLTRLISVIFLEIRGWRRRPGQKNTANTICLNMFMDSAHLKLPKKEQDLYSAHEVVQVLSLINRYQIHEQFLQVNAWVKKYLPHTAIHPVEKNVPDRFIFHLFSVLNWLLQKVQMWYMRTRLTSEIVSKQLIRFHPLDARGWVMAAYRKRLQKLGIPLKVV